MPVREISPGRFQWGHRGRIYSSRAAAEAQARAAYAAGYREDSPAARLRAHRAMSASRKAETTYVLAISRIMGAAHDAVMRVVRREYLPPATAAGEPELHHDSAGELAALPAGALPVPVVRQPDAYSCGPAAVLAVLRYWLEGYDADGPEQLYAPLRCTPADGTEPGPMLDALRAAGLDAELRAGVTLAELAQALGRGETPIVALQAYRYGASPWRETWNAGHYVVVVAIDAERVYVADPGPCGPYAFVARGEFEDRWHDEVGLALPAERVEHLAILARGRAPRTWRPLLPQERATRLDAAEPPPSGPRIGLSDDLLRRIFRRVRPQVQLAFDQMAKDVDAGGARGHSVLGINPRALPGLQKVIDKARQENVDLITNATDEFLDQIKDVLEEYGALHPGRGSRNANALEEAVEAGEETAAAEEEGAQLELLPKAERGARPRPAPEREPADLAEALQQRVDVSRSRAVLIARDQTLKLNGALNAHRQQAAGVTRFRWITSRDERVRPSHREVDGKVFSWDDDAREAEMADFDISDDMPDEPAPTPGSPIQCRCTPTPIIEELDVAGEEGGEAEEPDEELGQAAE